VDALPPFETSTSFPSGHSLNAAAIAGIVAYVLVRRFERTWQRLLTVALAVVFSLLMGLSRVYLGHHWFTDVVAGFIAGTAWAIVVILAHRLLLRVQQRRAQRSRTGSGI